MNHELALMHIFAQEQWHDEAYIIANRDALLNLRKAIDDALEKGHGFAPAFVGDGEGFNTIIVQQDSPVFDNLAVPYTDEIAGQQVEGTILPWKMQAVRDAYQEAKDWLEKEKEVKDER